VPVRILRASQFHEFVPELMEWGNQGDVTYVPTMRTQLVAARSVAEELAALAVDPASAPGPISEIAGPREERLVEVATMLAGRRACVLRGTRVNARSVRRLRGTQHAAPARPAAGHRGGYGGRAGESGGRKWRRKRRAGRAARRAAPPLADRRPARGSALGG